MNGNYLRMTLLLIMIVSLGCKNISAFTGTDSLKYLGQATVKIKTGEGKVIYIDPYAGTDYADSADVILVTHQHGDHNKIGLVKQKKGCVVITNAESNVNGVYKSFTVGSIKIDAVPAYNQNHQKSACVGYVIEINGIKIYHCGDTSKIPEMAELAGRKLDYAMLCMDGLYNMTPEEAVQCSDLIKARFYIPIHTTTSPTAYSDAIVARFTVPNKLIVKIGASVELQKASTKINREKSMPDKFGLLQNYPNPFNPVTTIIFNIPEPGHVSLKIFDILGNEVVTLVNEYKNAGRYNCEWHSYRGSGIEAGVDLASGVFFYQLRSGVLTETKKLMVMK